MTAKETSMENGPAGAQIQTMATGTGGDADGWYCNGDGWSCWGEDEETYECEGFEMTKAQDYDCDGDFDGEWACWGSDPDYGDWGCTGNEDGWYCEGEGWACWGADEDYECEGFDMTKAQDYDCDGDFDGEWSCWGSDPDYGDWKCAGNEDGWYCDGDG